MSRYFRLILLILIPVIVTNHILAENNSTPHKNTAKQNRKGFSNNDVSKKIDQIFENLEKEVNINNNDASFDSLASIAITLAESTFIVNKILPTYRKYFNLIQSEGNFIDFQTIVNKTEKLIMQNEIDFDKIDLWLEISESAVRLNNYTIANKFALKAFSEAEITKQPVQKILAYLALGKSLELQKYYIEAYQNFLNALYLTESIQEFEKRIEIKKKCLEKLFTFNLNVNDFEQASKYKLIHIELVQSNIKIDSLEFYWTKYDLCGLAILAKKYGNILNNLNDILRFAYIVNNKKLIDYTFSLYRKYLIETNDLSGIYQIYKEKYPGELERLKLMQPVLYYQIKSKLSEYRKDIQNALIEYRKASEAIDVRSNPVFKSNFYIRYGHFLLKYDKLAEASKVFKKAYDEAEKIHFTEHMLESSKCLDSIYYTIGNFIEAYKYSEISKKLIINQVDNNKKDEFLRMELANETKEAALNQERLIEEQKRKFNLQYFIITMSILFFFLVFIIFSRLKVPEWSIKGLGFISVLMLFEFIILIMDQEIHHITHGAPLWIFAIKVLILIFLFPLHHIIEKAIIKFMIQKKQIWQPSKSHFREVMHKLWPWMKAENEEKQ